MSCRWGAFWSPNPSPILTLFLHLGSLFGSFLGAHTFSANPHWYLRFLGVQMCGFFGSGHGAILRICCIGCYISVAAFTCKSEMVSAIFGSSKSLPLRGWSVVQVRVFEALVAHLLIECIFELPKRISEPEFSLLGCSGKPIGPFLNQKTHEHLAEMCRNETINLRIVS